MNTKLLLQTLLLSAWAITTQAQDADVIGVTEPKHEIDLAFPESGIIAEIAVEEGQSANKGELLVKLDSRVLAAKEKRAKIKANSMEALRAAYSEMTMREKRLNQVKQLGARNSNPDEIAKADVDHEMAKARYEAADEEVQTSKIELEQIEVEIERRMLRSPIDGIVARIYRDVAESVVGGETVVASIVNLDQLNLVVHVPAVTARGLKAGSKITVAPTLSSLNDSKTEATIAFVSPVVNASSGTKLVRLQIENPVNAHESGVKYQVLFQPGLVGDSLVSQR
ncbi:MAG: efflux RND transporter periplasmic adaptor subunit [Verrucomicrobiales bacterium]